MKNREYKWTPKPEINNPFLPTPTRDRLWYIEVSFSPSMWEKNISVPWWQIKAVSIRAIAGSEMSIWDAVINSFRISQGSIKLAWWLGLSFTASSNVVNAWGNTAKVSKFRGDGIILNFSAVSWTITLQITSY